MFAVETANPSAVKIACRLGNTQSGCSNTMFACSVWIILESVLLSREISIIRNVLGGGNGLRLRKDDVKGNDRSVNITHEFPSQGNRHLLYHIFRA